MRRLAIFSLAALAACSSNGEQYSDSWDRLSREHYRQVSTPEGAAWERSFLPVHNTFWPAVHAACADKARDAGFSEFSAIAVVGADGVVRDFLVMPRDPGLACFAKQMIGRKYPPPPAAPFHELFEFRLGGE